MFSEPRITHTQISNMNISMIFLVLLVKVLGRCMGLDRVNNLALTISLMGLAFILYFQENPYYFWGQPPGGFSLGTVGLLLTLAAVIVNVFYLDSKE